MKGLLTLLILVFLLLPFVALGCAASDWVIVPDKDQQTPSLTQIDPNKPIKVVVSSDGQNQGIDPWWKDFWDIVAKIGAFLGLGVAVAAASIQFSRNREVRRNELAERNDRLEQRKQELAWKQEEARRRDEEVKREKANLARTVLGDMNKDTYANDAMSMLDWGERDYDVRTTPGAPATVDKITERDMWAGLRIAERQHFVPKERYIRDCFDRFFGVMRTLENYIKTELIDIEDVRDPFAYFANLMKEDGRWIYEYYINEYHPKAAQFLKRFPEWTTCVACSGSKERASGCHTCEGTGNYTLPGLDNAYFMFDCPPSEERFVFVLNDREKISTAREEILAGRDELHLTATVVPQRVSYNQPWDFYLDPGTISFVKADQTLADQINLLVEKQRSRAKATFPHDDIWHCGGARLLAEIPVDRFDGDQAWQDGQDELRSQGRVRSM